MSLRRILYAGTEGRTVRIGPKVEELEIAFVLLTKRYSGCAPPDCIDVELDGSVTERDAFEYRIAAVQPHQAVIKAQLPKELRVLFRLPAVRRHLRDNYDLSRFNFPCEGISTVPSFKTDQELFGRNLYLLNIVDQAAGLS